MTRPGRAPAIRRKTDERGVFRAIRKVFASFYNDNAFLERLKHDVNEAQVGMALLVHHSFPDEIELANGVATLEKTRGPGWSVSLVSQKGAVSVTNPPTDAVPEEVRIDAGFQGPSASVVQRSSLVSLRENTVLAWDAEYLQLYELLVGRRPALLRRDAEGRRRPRLRVQEGRPRRQADPQADSRDPAGRRRRVRDAVPARRSPGSTGRSRAAAATSSPITGSSPSGRSGPRASGSATRTSRAASTAK